MRYTSTRGTSFAQSTYEALLKGLADDGGLYVPQHLPPVTFSDTEIATFTYTDYAQKILPLIFDDIPLKDLDEQIDLAYKVFEKNILPLQKVGNQYVMELYHGPTFAFKDFALALLPRLMSLALKKKNSSEKLVILTATSGDTGSAALYGFKNAENTRIIVFYPTQGISDIQRKQMTTIDGTNTFAIALEGNFDDAQRALKNLFSDKAFQKTLKGNKILLSSANSINIGRLFPQVVYYFAAYYQLVKNGAIKKEEPFSISVPTGNFGNILAAFLAKKMGLPVKDLICASNKNNVLTDFISTGYYNANRPFYQTNAPSMDILVSSNLERFLYHTMEDTEKVKTLMEDLKTKGHFEVNDLSIFKNLKGYSFDDNQTLLAINEVYQNQGYLMDTHTAIGYLAAKTYQKNHPVKVVTASTASPYKFPKALTQALSLPFTSEAQALDAIENLTKVPVPPALKLVLQKNATQTRVTRQEDIHKTILEVLL